MSRPSVSNRSDFIRVELNSDEESWALIEGQRMGEFRNSILGGRGNQTGCMGEHAVYKHFLSLGLDVKPINSYNYDMIVRKLRDDLKIEVKSKESTSPPSTNYDCSVNAANDRQECDMYVFTRRLKGTGTVWLLGWLFKEEFLAKRVFKPKGTVEPNKKPNGKNYVFREDCWNVPHHELRVLRR